MNLYLVSKKLCIMHSPSLLSVAAKFFDPLGILCPIATFSKILFQEICSKNFEWGSLLLVDILKNWELWLNKLA